MCDHPLHHPEIRIDTVARVMNVITKVMIVSTTVIV